MVILNGDGLSTSFFQPSTGAILEWIRNETVVLRSSSVTERSLHLSLLGVRFSDAGQYSCRARLSGGGTGGPVNAGYLRVLGKCAAIFIVVTLYLTIQQTAYYGF